MQPEEHNSILQSTAVDYVPNSNQISEEARKKLRIDRHRQATFSSELDSRVLTDAKADDWAKQQYLRQIQTIREMKKR